MDGAVSKHHSLVGVGVVIRDDKGRVVAALNKRIHAPLGPLEAEAKAFKAGFQFAKNVDIQEICGSGPLVIYGILSTLYDFCRVIFFHVCTQDNRFAHLLAKNVISIDNFFA